MRLPVIHTAVIGAPTLDQVASPCISICKIDPGEEEFCHGCWRTRGEIRGWKTASDAERLELLALLHMRREEAGAGSPRKRNSRRQKAAG